MAIAPATITGLVLAEGLPVMAAASVLSDTVLFLRLESLLELDCTKVHCGCRLGASVL